MDAESFKHIVIPHYRQMYMFALKLTSNPDDAQDAVQEAVTNLWRPSVKLDLICDQSTGDNPEQTVENKLKIAQIMTIINDLPPTQQQVILMRDVEGYELEEIARETGCSYGNIRVLLSRARTTIRKHF